MSYAENKSDIHDTIHPLQLQTLLLFTKIHKKHKNNKLFTRIPAYKNAVEETTALAAESIDAKDNVKNVIDAYAFIDLLDSKKQGTLNYLKKDKDNEGKKWENFYSSYVDFIIATRRNLIAKGICSRDEFKIQPSPSPCVEAYEKVGDHIPPRKKDCYLPV
jgi:hypothetical protein